jgi:hypothetical protein
MKLPRPKKQPILTLKEIPMIEFKPSDDNAIRLAEIDLHLKKLNAEMASPNIKEAKHAELNALYRRLSAEQVLLTSSKGSKH